LVDAIAPKTSFAELVRRRALDRAAASDRPEHATGIALPPLGSTTEVTSAGTRSPTVDVSIERELGAARIVVRGPAGPQPSTGDELVAAGTSAWLLAAARELDHAVLHLRFNEPEIGTWILTTAGNPDDVAAAEQLPAREPDHWLVRECRLYWTRTLKRLDASARTLVALVEPGSCFAGTLAELALAADRSFMFDGERSEAPQSAATLRLTDANDGWYPMSNGLSRLETRFWKREDAYAVARDLIGKDLLAGEAAGAELVTFALDDIDWDDEVRVMLEERNSFSPDALTAMEANLRFVGPETLETKIFARLSAWQNWIFQRPNAVGPEGALRRFGTGSRPTYDRTRV
jgi:benzoyl-CoA-dihydrodiol lyase